MNALPRPSWPLVATGTACGIAWAAGLRGWMVQMAGPAESHFTWVGTFGLQLAPGAVVGAAFGYAEYRRRTGGARSRWLVLAPLAFLVALAMPWIFIALITSGIGSGAIGVTAFGLAGGYALSGRGHRLGRSACGVLAVLGVLLMAVMASDHAPLGMAQGDWVAVYASSMLALLCLACAIPQRIGVPTVMPAWVAVGVGALAGLFWSAALRAFMFAVAGSEARVQVVNTFGFVLLPGAVIGAVLAWAEWRRRSGPVPRRPLGDLDTDAVRRGAAAEPGRPDGRLRRRRRSRCGRRPSDLHDRRLRVLRPGTPVAARARRPRADRVRARLGSERHGCRGSVDEPRHPARRLGRRPLLVAARDVLDRCRTPAPCVIDLGSR